MTEKGNQIFKDEHINACIGSTDALQFNQWIPTLSIGWGSWNCECVESISTPKQNSLTCIFYLYLLDPWVDRTLFN